MWRLRLGFSSISIQSGGYDYKFVEEPPDSLKCLICLLVAKDPQQHGGCGKLFCKTCIATYRAQRNDCPHCRQLLSDNQETTILNDFKSDLEVKSLLIRCSKSCGWQGELGALDTHLRKECKNSLVPCPNMCNNGTTIVMRMNLEYHLHHRCPKRKQVCQQCGEMIEYLVLYSHEKTCPKRQYSCPLCNEPGCYDERITTHLNVCPNVTIQCPQCSLRIFRKDYEDHPLSCTHESVVCKYYNIGCTERPLRKDANEHEKDVQLHLAIATNKVLELTNTLLLKNSAMFRVTNFSGKKTSQEIFLSDPFYTSRYGYKMCFRVDTNGEGDGKGTHLSVYTHLMKGDNDDSLTWPFTGTVTIELFNQLEDKHHYKLSLTYKPDIVSSKRVVNKERGSGFGYPQFISHTDLDYSIENNCQYLKNDMLVFRVSVKVPDFKPWLE